MTDHSAPEPTFDPRKWKRSTAHAATPADIPGVAPRSGASPARMAPFLALGGSAAILIGGALFAYASRQPEGSAAPAASVPGVVAPASSGAPRAERRMLVLSGPQDLRDALVASGVDARAARAASALALPALKPGGEIRAAMTLTARIGGGMDLIRLEASNPDSSGVIVERRDGRFAASPVAADLTTQVLVRRGFMDEDSFYSSAVAAGVPNGLIADFAAALAFDFDFAREVTQAS